MTSATPMHELLLLWEQLRDIPTDGNDCIEVPFAEFSAGTNRETIWHWFEAQNPSFVVGDLMNGVATAGIFKVGNIVTWHKDSRAREQTVQIARIELCAGLRGKHGTDVDFIGEEDKERCCFTLTNGHWAYGDEISHRPATQAIA